MNEAHHLRLQMEQDRADRAIHEAVRREIEQYRRLGLPIAVERDGTIEWVEACDIQPTTPQGPAGPLMVRRLRAANARAVKVWLEEECPRLFSTLKPVDDRMPPAGLIAYLSPRNLGDMDTDGLDQLGKQHLRNGERALELLYQLSPTGLEKLPKRIAAVRHESQLVELLCELAVCARVGVLAEAGSLQLEPRTLGRKHCDFAASIHGVALLGEVKRSADLGPGLDARGNPRPRALSVHSHRDTHGINAPRARSRAEHLRSKLDGRAASVRKDGVPEQFSAGTVNVLFLFEDAWTPIPHVRATLLGDRYYFHDPKPGEPNPDGDGLFADDRWRIVSGCCWMTIYDGSAHTQRLWENPNAAMPLPAQVRATLAEM